MGNTVFFGGVPTQKDIKALALRFADIKLDMVDLSGGALHDTRM